jgi:hypothetical protein
VNSSGHPNRISTTTSTVIPAQPKANTLAVAFERLIEPPGKPRGVARDAQIHSAGQQNALTD